MTIAEQLIEALNRKQGQTARQLHELISSGDTRKTDNTLARQVSRGFIFRIDATPFIRYFSSAEARDAMREQVEQESAAHVAAKREAARLSIKDRDARRYLAVKALRAAAVKKAPAPQRMAKPKAIKPPKPAKPPKPPKTVTLAQPKPRPESDKLQAFKQQEARIPDHVQIQRIPTPPPRFHVSELPRHGFAGLGIGRYYPDATGSQSAAT